MASTTKQSTKWGSFFEKAVAGVESRLDTILGEDDGSVKQEKQTPLLPNSSEKVEPSSDAEPVKPSEPLQALPPKRPDRLQERLAKALVGRNSPVSGSRTPSLASTSPRASLDRESIKENRVAVDDTAFHASDETSKPVAQANLTNTVASVESSEPMTQADVSSLNSTGIEEQRAHDTPGGTVNTHNGATTELVAIQNDQDVNVYLEQIESLRAKLQFLTQQAASEARERARDAENGSLQRQIAEKDEKIALLLEEGSKLSQNELKLMTNLKSLRNKSAEDHKHITKAKQNEEQMEKSIKNLQEKLKLAEVSEKDDSKQTALLEKVKKDLDQARNDAQSKEREISELQQQLTQNAIVGQKSELSRKELDIEKIKNRDLQEEVSNAKLERSLLEDRQKTQIRALESKFEREIQNSKSTELDLKREVQILESRLETYRTKAEEVSTDAKADIQAKLVRQIETLQSSYSVASENWKGIESSLMARIAALEKDQAEAQKKEAELRRKLREASSKNKEMDVILEESRLQAADLEERLSKEIETHKLTASNLDKAETELRAAQEDLRCTKESLESRLEKLEIEKQSAVQESLSLRSRAQSPLVKSGFEPSVTSSRRYQQSLGLAIPNGLGLSERPHSRRTSVQPSPGFMPSRQDSIVSLPHSTKNSIPPTPVINEAEYDDDDFFATTPATPPERAIHDMISTSTAGAGPSVQLVERMSAAVRRLESEKQASKDELERLSGQRDEARNQVVGLMQELEEKKQNQTKTADLEKEILELNSRLQTTLEMLGEKSELVEELRADIADMKEIYRATLESTVR